VSEGITWRFLFRRLWQLIRLRFAKQHMCEECGDALTHRPVYGYAVKAIWECESCTEWRAIQERNRPKPSPEDLAAQRRFAEALMNQPGALGGPGLGHDPRGLFAALSGGPTQQDAAQALARAMGTYPPRGVLDGMLGSIGNPLGGIFGGKH